MRVRKIAKGDYFVTSVRLSVLMKRLAQEKNSMKFDAWIFVENFSRNSKCD
jgi:hypothetical protein